MEMSGNLHTPAVSLPVTIVQEAGWVPDLLWTWWRREKIPSLPRSSAL